MQNKMSSDQEPLNMKTDPTTDPKVDPQLQKLIEAIGQNQIKEATKIITENPHLLTQHQDMVCQVPGCKCICQITPIEYLIAGTGDNLYHSDNLYHADRILMLVTFFKQKLIKPEHFADSVLFNFMKRNLSSDYQFHILNVLIKYIPKEQWVGIRSKTELNILYAILFSHMAKDKMEYYFKLYMAMGADPTFFSGEHEDEGYVYQQGSVMRILIDLAMPDLILHILSKFKLDRSYFNEIYDDDLDQEENAAMICLRNNSQDKDPISILNVRETFQICLEHELDTDHKNKYSETIHDYVAFYQWQTVLGDLIALPVGAGKNMEERLRISKSESKLMDYIKSQGPQLMPTSAPLLSGLTELQHFVDSKLRLYRYEKDPAQNHLLEMELLTHLMKILYSIYSDLASEVRTKCDPFLNSNDTIDLIESVLLSNLKKHDGNILNTIYSIEHELLMRGARVPDINLIISKLMMAFLKNMKYGGLMGVILEGLNDSCENAYGYLSRPFIKEWKEKLIEHHVGFV